MEGGGSKSKKCSSTFSIENLIGEQSSRRPTDNKPTGMESKEIPSVGLLNVAANTAQFLTSTPQFTSRSFSQMDRLSPEMRSPSPIYSEDGDKENKMNHLKVDRRGNFSSPNTSNGSENSECDTSSSRRKKARTAFSSEQLCELERRFRLHKYLGTDERSKLAEELGLSDQQVKTWFQNRRMKEKRQMRELEQLKTIPMPAAAAVMSNERVAYPLGFPAVSAAPTSALPGFTLFPPSFPLKAPSLHASTGYLPPVAAAAMGAYSTVPAISISDVHSVPQMFPVQQTLLR